MLTILDISNHWSETGGGVRRYQLEKCAAFAERDTLRHVLVTPDRLRATTPMRPGVVREHVRAPEIPGTGGYRYLLRSKELAELIAEHRPEVVVCGSPIVMPALIKRALRRARHDAVVVGFWHADFPRTYFGRAGSRLGLSGVGESLGWTWARHAYAGFDATLVASRAVGRQMLHHGLGPLYFSPLGVDTTRFHPLRRDPELRSRVQAGDARRKIIFFPHRFCEEKGLPQLLDAYDRLTRAELDGQPLPALVFAGAGPHLAAVEAAAQRFKHAHYLGYLHSVDELATWYASSDLCISLSAWETFGLSTAEAMASGLAIVSANQGAAPELVREGNAGICVDRDQPVEIAEALRNLVCNPELESLGRNARRRVEALSWGATFERELAVYRELVRLRRAGDAPPPGLHAAAELVGPGEVQGHARRAKATSSRAERIHSSSIECSKRASNEAYQ